MSIIKVMNIADLTNHPINDQIYTGSNTVEDLKESISIHGQLTPLTATSKGVITSGHRRVKAMLELGIKEVNVIVKDYPTPEDEIMAVIAFNNQRKKTYNEMYNEIIKYRELWGNRQGQRTDLTDNKGDGLTTRQRISIATGISEGNIQKLEFISKNMPQLLPFIFTGEHSIHSAEKEAKKLLNETKPKVNDVVTLPETTDTVLFDTESNPEPEVQLTDAATDENLLVHPNCTCPNCGHQFTNQ